MEQDWILVAMTKIINIDLMSTPNRSLISSRCHSYPTVNLPHNIYMVDRDMAVRYGPLSPNKSRPTRDYIYVYRNSCTMVCCSFPSSTANAMLTFGFAHYRYFSARPLIGNASVGFINKRINSSRALEIYASCHKIQ